MKLTKRNLQKLTPDDRNEVEAFQELCRDMGNGLTGDALWEKYGEAYLGPKPERRTFDVPVHSTGEQP